VRQTGYSPAGWKPAIRQVGNLRYEAMRSVILQTISVHSEKKACCPRSVD